MILLHNKDFHRKREEIGVGYKMLMSSNMSAPTDRTLQAIQSQPCHRTYISNLVPVPRVSQLCLKVIIGFGVLQIKYITGQTPISAIGDKWLCSFKSRKRLV